MVGGGAAAHHQGRAGIAKFDEDTAVGEIGDGRYQVEVSGDWGIGPNPNGGFVLALVTNAMRQVAGATHPDPLSMTAHYLRPTSGGERADIDVGVVRQGRRHTHLEATLSQGTERVRALAVFGDLGTASGPTAVRAEPPDLPEPDECIARASVEGTVTVGSTFLDRFDTRLSPDTGWLTGNPTGVAEVGGWMRFADGREPDVASLGLFADALPPAVFELGGPAGWVPTVELTVHVRARPAPGWLRARFGTRFLVDGYLEEDGEIWDSTGRLVAQSRQLALLLP